MKRFVFVLTALSLVVFTVTGCSGGNSGSTSTTLTGSSPSQSSQSGSSGSPQQSSSAGSSQGQQLRPEQLISKVEAAALLGEAVREGAFDEYPQFGLSLTFYAAENASSKNYLQIAVLQQAAGGGGQGSQPSQSQSGQPSQSQSGQPSQSQSGQPSQSGGAGGGQNLSPGDIFEGLKKLFSDPYAPITGRMGDDFFLSAQGISILYGEQYIYISVGTFSAADAQNILKAAGDLAIINIKRILGE